MDKTDWPQHDIGFFCHSPCCFYTVLKRFVEGCIKCSDLWTTSPHVLCSHWSRRGWIIVIRALPACQRALHSFSMSRTLLLDAFSSFDFAITSPQASYSCTGCPNKIPHRKYSLQRINDLCQRRPGTNTPEESRRIFFIYYTFGTSFINQQHIQSASYSAKFLWCRTYRMCRTSCLQQSALNSVLQFKKNLWNFINSSHLLTLRDSYDALCSVL